MKKLLLIVVLSLLLAGCGEAIAPVATPAPTATLTPIPTVMPPAPTATPVAQSGTMESAVHAYDSAHFVVYFVSYHTLVSDTSADFTSVEWDCFPPQPPDHPHAFFAVSVGRQKGMVSYDGQTLRLTPGAGSTEVGTIGADGTWSMLEEDTGLNFTYKVATDTPEILVKRYDGALCTPSA